MKSTSVEVIILGGGFAGVGAAIKLLEAGISDFLLLEKATELGGVWRENTYPGCACDVPSALYSYSFAPNPSWSRVFAGQREIKSYLQTTAHDHGVSAYVRLQHEALKAQWCDSEKHWRIDTNQGVFIARFVIMACGPMHEPVLPTINGLSEFAGEIFHSSQWRHDVDLSDKRVAVIGSGASAIQFVPEIQPDVQKLTLFQRTPHWVLPKMDQPLPTIAQRVFKHIPVTQMAMRGAIYSIFEVLNGGMQRPAAMRQFQKLALWNIRAAIKDTALRAKVTPNYVIGCKRVLQSSNWYPTLAKPNVDVVAGALASVEGNTLIDTLGNRHEVDVIILGTGFEVAEPPIAKRIHGRDGRSMAEVWQGSPEGYMGTMVAGCPNGFLMFGPNIAVSSSAFIIIEAQLTYIINALQQARQQGITVIEADPVRMAEFNDKVQKALAGSVWNTGGCSSYFIDKNGRNSTVWPWSTLAMRSQLRQFNLDEYITQSEKTL